MRSFRFMVPYLKRYRWKYVWGMVILLAVDIANVLIPKIVAYITDGLQTGGFGMNQVLFYLGIFLASGAVIAIGRFLWRYCFHGASRSIERDLRNDMFRHLEELDVDFYHENKTGDLMSHFTSDMDAIRMAMGMAMVAAFDATIMDYGALSDDRICQSLADACNHGTDAFDPRWHVCLWQDDFTAICGSSAGGIRSDGFHTGELFRCACGQGFCARARAVP